MAVTAEHGNFAVILQFLSLVLDEFQILEDLEEQTAMGGEEGSKHERFNRHQLDENVERRS